MARRSAGLLLYRVRGGVLEVLLVHPGGPFWIKRDAGSWSIPKGEYEQGEPEWLAALREFEEETGLKPPPGTAAPLGEAVQPSGKRITAFALEGDVDITQVKSNTFEIEWPPRSRRMMAFQEVDRAAWFPVEQAREKIVPGQGPFLDRLINALELS